MNQWRHSLPSSQDQMIKWLNTMRLGVGGFIGTVDTIVALEAVVRYSYNNNIKVTLLLTYNLNRRNKSQQDCSFLVFY
jgi:hypothetical protein